MLVKTFATFALAGAALATSLPARAEKIPRCAVEPSEQQRADTKLLMEIENLKAQLGSHTKRAPIVVDTYFHVVSSSRARFITEAQVQRQLEYLNQAYAPHEISFNLIATDFTVNTSWAAGNGEMAMKRSLRKGDYSTLNAYFVDTPRLDGFSALGYCMFPEPGVTAGSQLFIRDGCVVMAQTVPGGSQAPYNLGGTLVHEVGHWFDVYHTFQDGCNGGDLVSDTPASASMSDGCPVGRDSCPNQAGLDPIHNFMDYSDDACYEEFTAGQEARMRSAWENFRN
ncbi:metalloprotease MEP1 [Paramyrothecium foliicola]|nr:metalloprotease MEP1 [Paramyrothecium foliicola]